ncbi:MAG TPA: hypothetical protein VIK63_03725 [Haloplasmataceae bacterium]
MKPYPYPHGPMPMLQGPMGAFPGQSPMMGPGMGQPIPQPFGMPYTDVPPQISFEQIQMDVQPLIQEAGRQVNRVALMSYLLGLGYSLNEARQMVDSYLPL